MDRVDILESFGIDGKSTEVGIKRNRDLHPAILLNNCLVLDRLLHPVSLHSFLYKVGMRTPTFMIRSRSDSRYICKEHCLAHVLSI